MTYYPDKISRDKIIMNLAKDLQSIGTRFTGELLSKFDGVYNYDSKIFDGNNHPIATCSLATEDNDYEPEDVKIANIMAMSTNFCSKYHNILQELLFKIEDK